MGGHDLRLVPAAATAWACAAWAVAQRWQTLASASAVAALLAVVAAAVCRPGQRARQGRRGGPGRCGPGRWADAGRWPGQAGEGEHLRGRPAAATLLCAAVAFAVLGAQATAAARRDAEPVRGWASGRVVASVSGVVTQDAVAVRPGRFPGPARYLVRVGTHEMEARGALVDVAVPVLVLGGATWAAATAGQQVRFEARLGPAERGDGLAAVAAALGPPRTEPGRWMWRAADHVRAGLRRACVSLSADPRGLLPALVVGDTANLPPGLTDDLRAAGMTHLTAVSGANVAIVAGAALWAAGVAGAGRSSRIWLALTAVVAFVVLARPQPSVLRAAVMGSVALLGLLRARRPRGVPVLAAATVLLLAVAPGLSRSPGFALSVVATAALVTLAPVWAARLQRWLPRPLAVAVAVPAAAQAACGPIVVLLNPAVSTTAVPANLLVAPAVAPATVLGVLAALASVVWPPAATVLAWCGGLAAGWVATVAHRAADVPGSSLPWPSGRPGAALLALVTAAVVALSLRVAPVPDQVSTEASQPPAERPGRREGGLAGSGALLAVVAVLLGIGAGWVLGPSWAGAHRLGGAAVPDRWAVAMCDVGQGDMLVLRSGAASGVVVDAGPDPPAADGCLRRLGVRAVDLVVLTHFHADHVMGLPGVLAGRRVGGVVVTRFREPAGNADSVTRWLRAAGVRQAEGAAGLSGDTGPGVWRVRWRLLAADRPGGASGEGGGEADGAEVNESSLVTEAVVTGPYGAVRVVGLGDLEAAGQAGLAAALAAHRVGLGGPVDVVKVAHHGSATQDPLLYRQLGAAVALLGVGAGNDYGHPADATLALLAAAGARTFRTDTCGLVVVSVGNDALSVVAEEPP